MLVNKKDLTILFLNLILNEFNRSQFSVPDSQIVNKLQEPLKFILCVKHFLLCLEGQIVKYYAIVTRW